MTIKGRATLLTAESKPYSVNGNEGVSHKARFLVENEIYSLKCDESTVKALKPMQNETGELTFELTSPKENVKLVFTSFE